MLLLEGIFHFFTDSGVVHPHLRKEMEVVEVRTAVIVIHVAFHQFDNTVHGCSYSCHILVDKFRKCFCRFCELIGRRLHLYGILVCHRHEQVEFVGKIIHHPCLYHSAGFRQRADTRLFVIHLQKHLKCFIYHFFSVGNHIGLYFFMFFCEDTLFILKFLYRDAILSCR